jgi:coenzyme PQQ precursor peptide PqqA
MKIMSGFYAICAVDLTVKSAHCVCRLHRHPQKCNRTRSATKPELQLKRNLTMWTKPEYTEMRFGFEVTMYIANR